MTARGNPAFVRRAWTQPYIRAWLASTDPAFVLTGPPGSGKSTLVGRPGDLGVRPAATHACRARVLSSTEPIPVLASVAAALARAVPGYADAVIRRQPPSWREAAARVNADGPTQARLAVLDSADPFAAYERALRRPLSTLAAAGELGRDLVVAIDGLDEAGHRGSELSDLLAVQSHQAVPFLRLLLTTRPGPVAQRLSTVPGVDLASDPSTVDTVLEVLKPSKLRKGVRQAIADAAEGNFVYAQLAANSRDLTERPPTDLGALYGHILGGGRDSVIAGVLGVVCQGRDSGLSPARLAEILEAERDVVEAALTTSRRLLLGDRLVKPHHRCLVDYLVGSARPALGRIADYIAGRWRGRWERCGDAYALRNLVPHLADAAAPARSGEYASADYAMAARTLHETLADPAYLVAAVATIGLDEVRAALSYARHRIAGTAADDDTLRTLATSLHADARTLRDCRSRGPATRQLAYVAATLGATGLAQGLTRLNERGDVETLWATADLLTRDAPQVISGHTARVTALDVAANGTQAVSAALDGTTRVWRLASGRLTTTVPTQARVEAVQSAPDAEQVLAASSHGTAPDWERTTGEEWPVTSPFVPVSAFALARDRSRAVTGDPDNAVTIWDRVTAPEPLLRLPRHSGRVTAVALSEDGRHVAAASEPGEVTVWDVHTESIRLRLHHGRRVTALCLTAAADRVVVGDAQWATVHAVPPEHRDAVYARLGATDTVVGRLATRATVTALAANPAIPSDFIFGTALGQVGYVRLP